MRAFWRLPPPMQGRGKFRDRQCISAQSGLRLEVLDSPIKGLQSQPLIRRRELKAFEHVTGSWVEEPRKHSAGIIVSHASDIIANHACLCV